MLRLTQLQHKGKHAPRLPAPPCDSTMPTTTSGFGEKV